MFDERQLGSGMELTKVYLIHERTDQEDPPPGAAQKIFRCQWIGKRVRVKPLALVGNDKNKRRACVFKARYDLFGGVVIVAVEHGIYSSFAYRHGHTKALVLVQAGLLGQLVRGSFHLANAFHR